MPLSIYDSEMPVIVPGKYGDIDIEYFDDIESYILSQNGVQWIKTDKYFIVSKDLLHSQYDLAYGDVLVTGLGFGIIAKALANKQIVSSVTVLELNRDVIDAYIANNILEPNVKIIQADASTYVTDKKYDCLLPDHYELQPMSWILKDMKTIAKNIPNDVYWPWGIEEMFFIKVYPKKQINLSSKEFLEKYKEEIPVKWKEFVVNNLDSQSTLLNLNEEKLFEYLEKYAPYYYDSDEEPLDWESK